MLVFELRSSIVSQSQPWMRQTPDSRASTPAFAFASPCHPARGVLPRMPSTTPRHTSTRTQNQGSSSSLSHARPSFANPCMQCKQAALTPHPARDWLCTIGRLQLGRSAGAATKDQGRRLVRGHAWLHRIGELSEWAEHRQRRRRASPISQRHKNSF